MNYHCITIVRYLPRLCCSTILSRSLARLFHSGYWGYWHLLLGLSVSCIHSKSIVCCCQFQFWSPPVSLHWAKKEDRNITAHDFNGMVRLVFSTNYLPWWRHQMETFSALLVLCAGNSLVTGEFPSQMPVTRTWCHPDAHAHTRAHTCVLAYTCTSRWNTQNKSYDIHRCPIPNPVYMSMITSILIIQHYNNHTSDDFAPTGIYRKGVDKEYHMCIHITLVNILHIRVWYIDCAFHIHIYGIHPHSNQRCISAKNQNEPLIIHNWYVILMLYLRIYNVQITFLKTTEILQRRKGLI